MYRHTDSTTRHRTYGAARAIKLAWMAESLRRKVKSRRKDNEENTISARLLCNRQLPYGECFERGFLGSPRKNVLRESYEERQNFQSFHRNRQIIMETFNDVINGGQLVLVDFFATWCQPCKMMHPILEQVKNVLGNRIRIIKVDVDKYGATASQYRIQSVPTLMLFRNGEVLWRTSGVVEKAELLATLDPFLKQ